MSATAVVKKPWGSRVWEAIRDFLVTILGILAIIVILILSLVVWVIPYLVYVALPFGVAVGVGVLTKSLLLTAISVLILERIAKWLWEKYASKWYEKLCQEFDAAFSVGLDEDYDPLNRY
ncbi:MAG: hypothetical protein Q8N84_03955 [bacterium]|nr:hypothetical protein [bacterium]